ncbi:MAG: triose-phosphate isomerase [Patulibacter sp.]|nr:triose-phosphate isomerase [Patulibacter sp.]
MSRIPLIAGNWKMHKTVEDAEDFVAAFLPLVQGLEGVELALCAPFTALGPLVDSTRGSKLQILAQNVHQAGSGAFTGEISAVMLLDLDVHGSVIGHSERRQFFGETDEALAEKLVTLLQSDLLPILCVGESDEQREAGETEAVLQRQVDAAIAPLTGEQLAKIVVAYEPIWAIGTGKVATTEQAQEACAFVRSRLAAKDAGAAEQVRVLYGGSVKPSNAGELLAQPDIDGALVGGASLEPTDLHGIAAAAVA